MELFRRVLSQRMRVLKIAGWVVLAGVVIALFGAVKFQAGSTMAPQSGGETRGGNLSSLAAMAGINLASSDPSGGLSPSLYPMVVSSIPFQKELMYTPVTVEKSDTALPLIDYLTSQEYRRFSLFPFIKRYTLGLPALVMGAIRGTGENDSPPVSVGDGVDILSSREWECKKILSNLVSVSVNSKEGYISLSAVMPEPVMAAQVAARMQELLQEYVTRFKVQKVQANLDFIEERYSEVKADFEEKQMALARFQDTHRNLTSALARTRENRLQNEYSLAFSLYSELSAQREQARIQVKEDTPVFTVLEPVTVPLERAAPKRGRIVVLSLVLGLFVGVVWVLVRDFFTRNS
jgi:uncharacterized protein involved in exopolysaccharide biosynthesis